MKFKYNIIAFLFIGILGTVSHFVFEWANTSKIIGYFFPVNESPWEHLKLLFFPTILFSLIEFIFVKNEIKNYVPSVIISVIIGMLSIITLYFTYTGILGYNIDFINIIIFYISIIITLFVKNKIIDSEKFSGANYSLIFLTAGFIITLMFIFYTYNPPSIQIFIEP